MLHTLYTQTGPGPEHIFWATVRNTHDYLVRGAEHVLHNQE